MNMTFDILVIVLSVLLGIFLILSIVIAAFVIKLVHTVRRIAEKGEQMVDSAEAAAELFRKSAGPLGVLKMITNIIDTVTKHKHK